MKALCPETLDQLADRWTVLMTQVYRHVGPYPGPFYLEVEALIRQTEGLLLSPTRLSTMCCRLLKPWRETVT